MYEGEGKNKYTILHNKQAKKIIFIIFSFGKMLIINNNY